MGSMQRLVLFLLIAGIALPVQAQTALLRPGERGVHASFGFSGFEAPGRPAPGALIPSFEVDATPLPRLTLSASRIVTQGYGEWGAGLAYALVAPGRESPITLGVAFEGWQSTTGRMHKNVRTGGALRVSVAGRGEDERGVFAVPEVGVAFALVDEGIDGDSTPAGAVVGSLGFTMGRALPHGLRPTFGLYVDTGIAGRGLAVRAAVGLLLAR